MKSEKKEKEYIVFEMIDQAPLSPKFRRLMISDDELVNYVKKADALDKRYYLFKKEDQIFPKIKVEVNF